MNSRAVTTDRHLSPVAVVLRGLAAGLDADDRHFGAA